MKNKTIQQALEAVANNPVPSSSDPIDQPVHELVCQALFDIANKPDRRVRGAMARATRAQKIVLDRLVGRRRAGTHPAQVRSDEIDFLDLTQSEIGATEPTEEPTDGEA